MFDGLKARFREWLFSKALKKAAVTAAQGAGAYLLAHSGQLQRWGVSGSVDPDIAAGALLAAAELARNALKHHFPRAFSWL